jgi:hypothetical protein
LKGNMDHLRGVVRELLTEGLTVAAWVSLWSAFAGLIFDFTGIVGNIRIFRRIASREVVFKERETVKVLQDGAPGNHATIPEENKLSETRVPA